jgi:hypothetical protein
MASVKSDISLQIKNNLNRTATFSILGGTQDPSNGQANAKTIYDWDLTAETFANTNVLTIEASTITNPTVITYEVANQDGAITDLKTVVRLLNTLNLGVFNLDGNTIWIIDDINIFGNISILVSLSFDINAFIQQAYNYFDSLGKTTLVDFQTRYTSVIEQAVNTIPNFVDFIESQGWGLAYVVEAEQIIFNRIVSGNLFVITDIGGILTTNTITDANNYDSGIATTVNKALIFVYDIQIFKGIQLLSLKANNSGGSYIYKNVFTGWVVFSPERNNLFGWIPLSSQYIPKNSEGLKITTIFLAENGITNIYGNSFPSVPLADGQDINFESALPSFNLGSAGGDANISFNVFDGSFDISIKEVQSINNKFDFNFNTLILDNTKFQNSVFRFEFSELSQPTVTLDSSFNTKFAKLSKLSNNLSQFTFAVYDTLVDSNQAIINFDNTTTPLVINSDLINLRRNYFQTLPPISQLGGYASNTEYNLLLLLINQGEPINISMRYFNHWFFGVGTQDAVYDESITSGTRLVAATSNTFLLSGRGLQGYYSLIENGYTVNIPSGTLLTGGSLSFTTRPNPPTLVTLQTITAGLGQSDFEITYSEDGQTDTVQASSFVAINQEQLQIANSSNELNVLMTKRPSLNTTSFNIGAFGFSDQFSTMLFTGSLFNNPIQQLTIDINGFTLDMPIYDAGANEVDARGLYQRDFQQALGSTLNINRFKINGTKIGNPTLQPHGSNKIINSTVVFSSFNTINFDTCTFGTTLVDDTLNNILDLLLPTSAIAFNGINFNNCDFNGVDNSNPYLQVTFPLASPNLFTQGLNGDSTIENTSFSQTQFYRILFTSDWNGIGYALTDLNVTNNVELEQINLQNSNTATPNTLNLNVSNNAILEVLNFTNHNVVSAIVLNNPLINNIDLSGNNLPSADLDNIIITLDNNGLTDGTLDYSNQTGGASPNIAVSGLAYNNLIAKGWTVTGNVPI